MRRIALCIGTAMLVHCGAGAAVAKCKPVEAETIVCNDGPRTLRVIRESASLSKRYAVGWTIEAGKNAMDGLDELKAEGRTLSVEPTAVERQKD